VIVTNLDPAFCAASPFFSVSHRAITTLDRPPGKLKMEVIPMIPITKLVARKVVALAVAAAVGCAGCAGNIPHTIQPHPSLRENWAAVMRVPTGTLIRIEDSLGVWTVGRLVAKEPQGITVDVRSVHRSVPRSQIRKIWMQHDHTDVDWTAIKDVAVGGVVGGVIGGLAVPKHRVISGSLLAGVGAFMGLVFTVITMFHDEKRNISTGTDEILVYYSDRVAAPPGRE
jgi:uncharacterized protein YcfJ